VPEKRFAERSTPQSTNASDTLLNLFTTRTKPLSTLAATKLRIGDFTTNKTSDKRTSKAFLLRNHRRSRHHNNDRLVLHRQMVLSNRLEVEAFTTRLQVLAVVKVRRVAAVVLGHSDRGAAHGQRGCKVTASATSYTRRRLTLLIGRRRI